MYEMKEEIEEEVDASEVASLHIESAECCCPECQKGKKHYVQILDIDRYINALNDWD